MVLAVLVTSSLQSAGLRGQEASRWLPGLRPFEPLIAAPREVQFRGSFVLADRPDTEDWEGRNVEAEVVLGHSLAVLRLDDGADPDRSVTLGYELAIFSRFFMESPQRDLINVDYRVGAPISVRHREWQVRVTIRHVSSHAGDDYMAAFPELAIGTGEERRQRTKDGIEGLLARRFGRGGRVYAGGDYNFHVNRQVSRAAFRAGVEWDPRGTGAHDRVWPFAAVDVEYPSMSERVSTTVSAGMGAMVNGRNLRLEARAHVGSSPMAQLGEAEETFFGVGISMIP